METVVGGRLFCGFLRWSFLHAKARARVYLKTKYRRRWERTQSLRLQTASRERPRQRRYLKSLHSHRENRSAGFYFTGTPILSGAPGISHIDSCAGAVRKPRLGG